MPTEQNARCMAFVFGHFSGAVSLKVVLKPLSAMEQALDASTLLQTYDPACIMSGEGNPRLDPLRRAFARLASENMTLVNWHAAAVNPSYLKGALEWEDTVKFVCAQ